MVASFTLHFRCLSMWMILRIKTLPLHQTAMITQLELIKTAPVFAESNERYTPPHIVELVTMALGGNIDLDPTSNTNNTTNARIFYTIDDNCLAREWDNITTAFMNPPFSNSAPFLEKWVSAYVDKKFKEGITLTLAGAVFNKSTQDYFKTANFLVIPKGRIEFIFPDNRKTSGNDRDVIFAHWGNNPDRAKSFLKRIGLIVNIDEN